MLDPARYRSAAVAFIASLWHALAIHQDAVTVRFRIEGDAALSLFWVSEHGTQYRQGSLPTIQETFRGHRFMITSDSNSSQKVAIAIHQSGDVRCKIVEGELEVSGSAIHANTSEPEQDPDDVSAQFFYKSRPAMVTFDYKGSEPARLSWINPTDGSRRLVGEVKSSTHSETTWTGHHFEVAVPGFPPSTVKILTAGTVHIGRNGAVSGDPLNDFPRLYKGPKWKAIVNTYREKCKDVWKNHPSDSTYFCDPSHDYRILNTAKFDHPSDTEFEAHMKPKHEEAALKVLNQAQRYQNFTKVGFKIAKIPTELHEKLLKFYRDHKYEAVPEPDIPWDQAALEGRTADTWLLNLPDALKQEAFEWVKGMVAKWAQTPAEGLRSTALYGLRFYHRDAVLGVHVDIEATHALSAILEVARNDEDDQEPWPLEILDHSGKLHHVPAKPGQLILYESATCGHGRSVPFPGRSMVNAFVHFAPEGWPEKFYSSAPAASPSQGYRAEL